MLFSVIIPVYNVEKYLGECLNSIMENCEKDFEIILVNDGSTDKSGKICDEFQRKNMSLCKVIHKKNQGALAARREGLMAACGKYIVFVDADDFIRKDMFHILKNEIIKSSPDVIIYQWQDMDENGKLLESDSQLSFASGKVDKDKVLEMLLTSTKLNPLWLKICKKELFDIEKDYSCFFNIKYGEDLLQSIPVIEKAVSFVYIPEKLYFYRSNPNSLTHRIRIDRYKNLNVVRPKLYEMLERLGKMDERNKILFFDMYSENLSLIVYQICKSKAENKIVILKEIFNYFFVRESKKYWLKSKISYKAKILLFMFYARMFRILIFLVSIIKK